MITITRKTPTGKITEALTDASGLDITFSSSGTNQEFVVRAVSPTIHWITMRQDGGFIGLFPTDDTALLPLLRGLMDIPALREALEAETVPA